MISQHSKKTAIQRYLKAPVIIQLFVMKVFFLFFFFLFFFFFVFFFGTDEHVIKITITGRGCDKGNGKRSIQLLFGYLNYKGNCLFLKEMAKN